MSWFTLAKKSEELFDYGEETRELWRAAIRLEQDRCGIRFDLENDNQVDTRVVELGRIKDDTETDNRVVARLCFAGGDWEAPVGYFRCQSETRFQDNKWRPQLKFVVIPEEGNPNLVKGKKGLVAKDSDDGEKVDDACKKALWGQLEKLARERILAYDEALGDDTPMDDTGAFRDLTVSYRSGR